MKKQLLPDMLEAFGFPVTLTFAKNGRAFVGERVNGRLWEISQKENRLVRSFPTVPIIGHNETGLLGIAIDPDFETNGYLYCYYTAGTSEKDFKNRVVRIKENGSGEKVLLDDIPAGMIHNGGIMAFGPDKTLYIGVGVSNEVKENAQDKKRLDGKVLRINRDGSIPKDNPFPNSPVYSYGHRNVFGLAFHPKTAKLYISDVGPDHDDEINIIEKGGNYGWPELMGKSNDKKFINPLISYTPVITPVQSVFVGNDLFFGSYNEGSVHKLTLSGKNFDEVEKDEIVYKHKPYSVVGVFYGPDNQFYLTTANSILHFEPKASQS